MIRKYYTGSTVLDMDETWSVVVPNGTVAAGIPTRDNDNNAVPVGSTAYTNDGKKEFTYGPDGWKERANETVQIATSRIVAKSEMSSATPLTPPSGTVWTSVNLKGIITQASHKVTSSDVGKYVVGRDWTISASST